MEMSLGSVLSHNGVTIRLTHERWAHIVESHDYMAGLYEWVLETLDGPEVIVQGWNSSLIATRFYSETPITQKHMVVVYREVTVVDGFVITAFMTSKVEKVWQRGIIWQKS